MHIVIGGAFNGKRDWVNKRYQTDKHVEWVDMQPHEDVRLPEWAECTLVLASVEQLTQTWAETHELDEARMAGQNWINTVLHWEQAEPTRKVVLIGTDFSKGIVPMEPERRKWRDVTGWFYQDLIKKAERVDQIWYGLSTQVK